MSETTKVKLGCSGCGRTWDLARINGCELGWDFCPRCGTALHSMAMERHNCRWAFCPLAAVHTADETEPLTDSSALPRY